MRLVDKPQSPRDGDGRPEAGHSRGQSTAEAFWDAHYDGPGRPWSGRSNPVLAEFADAVPAGRALDLGCGTGANALWLASRGWHVTAADVSARALERVADQAQVAGVADRIDRQRHDLAETVPAGTFDFVYAMYLQSPVGLPRARVLRRAAEAVAPGGLLLVVEHASVPPWSWASPDTVFPTPAASLAEIGLDGASWETVFLGAPERLATGPGGQTALVSDLVIALKRLPGPRHEG